MIKIFHGKAIVSLAVILALIAVGCFSVCTPGRASDLGVWALRESIPLGARYVHATAAVGGKIYVIGGSNNSVALDLVQEFTPATGAWAVRHHLSSARYAMAAVAYDGKVYIMGGHDGINALNTLEVYDPGADSWTALTNMPTARFGLSAVVLDGKIYAMGGRNGNLYYSIVEVYDIEHNTWSETAHLPTIRYYFDALAFDGKIYAIGGIGGSLYNSVDVYDPGTNAWTPRTAMPTARSFLEVAAVNGKIYAIGGYNNGPLTKVEEYDPAGDSWTVKQDMIKARRGFAVEVVDGKVYAVAGVNTAGFALTDTVEEYTPVPAAPNLVTAEPGDGRVTLVWNTAAGAASYGVKRSGTSGGQFVTIASGLTTTTYTDTNLTNDVACYYKVIAVNPGGESDLSAIKTAVPREAVYPWTEKAKLPTKRYMLKAVTVNGKIYALGGISMSERNFKVYEYNIANDLWSEKATLPVNRDSTGVVSFNNKIYIIGGIDKETGAYLTTVEEYEPETGALVIKASMPTARNNPAVAVANNKIYVIGGSSNGNPLSVTEEYDPTDTTNGYDSNGNPMGKWATKASFSTVRFSPAAATVNGKIYLVGGHFNNVMNNAVEEFDPVTNSWAFKTALPTARADLGAVAVGNRIYVIGGRSNSETYTNIVEEYDPVADSWATKPTIINQRDYFGITELNGSIYIIGGMGGLVCWDSILNSMEKYTPTPLTAISDSSIITLSWYTVGGAQSYTVKRADGPGGVYTAVINNLTTVSFTDTGLITGKPYYYMVYAVRDGVEIAVSNEAWALLGLAAPTNLTAVWEVDHYHFSWGGISKATGYYFKRSFTMGGPYTAGYQEANFTDYDLSTGGVTMYVVVSATNADGESPNSKELMVVFP
jgi:N-acetylneuraminic acid mutarotase